MTRKGLQISGIIKCQCTNAKPVKMMNVVDNFNKAFSMAQLISGQRYGRLDQRLQMVNLIFGHTIFFQSVGICGLTGLNRHKIVTLIVTQNNVVHYSFRTRYMSQYSTSRKLVQKQCKWLNAYCLMIL